MERRVPYLVKAAHRQSAGVLVVGIDPGEVTGVAAWDVGAQSFVHVGSGSFFEVLGLLDKHVAATPPAEVHRPEPVKGWAVGLVVVEDARRLPIYASRDGVRGRRRDRLCRDVGRIDRDVQLWADWLRARGLPVRLAEPLRGGKWDAATLARLTRTASGPGWTEPTNQHARDAARLVFGTTARHLETWGDGPPEAEGVS